MLEVNLAVFVAQVPGALVLAEMQDDVLHLPFFFASYSHLVLDQGGVTTPMGQLSILGKIFNYSFWSKLQAILGFAGARVVPPSSI